MLFPVVGGSTTIGYQVGAGGTGGSSANGSGGGYSLANNIPNLGTVFIYGGSGGLRGVAGQGGIKNDQVGSWIPDANSTSGNAGTSSAGGSSPGGGAGGSGTTGANGTAPGGGGAPNNVSSGKGGDGANGRVKFTWLGASTITNLRALLQGGALVTSPSAVGYNGFIPSSGTIKMRDFLGAEQMGFSGNSYPNGSNIYFSASDGAAHGGSAAANCYVTIGADGKTGPTVPYQTWLQRVTGNTDSTITANFDCLFNRTSASGNNTTLFGNTANVWIQCSTAPQWYIRATRSAVNGLSESFAGGFLAFRRRSDNVVVVNVAVSLYASAEVLPASDTK